MHAHPRSPRSAASNSPHYRLTLGGWKPSVGFSSVLKLDDAFLISKARTAFGLRKTLKASSQFFLDNTYNYVILSLLPFNLGEIPFQFHPLWTAENGQGCSMECKWFHETGD
jgi:hypothetical protein